MFLVLEVLTCLQRWRSPLQEIKTEFGDDGSGESKKVADTIGLQLELGGRYCTWIGETAKR
jgi:hypothetical protein